MQSSTFVRYHKIWHLQTRYWWSAVNKRHHIVACPVCLEITGVLSALLLSVLIFISSFF